MLPLNYRQWQNKTHLYLKGQVRSQSLSGLPFKKVEVEIQFIGSHRGDARQLAGAILDAMTKGGILTDDRINCIPKLILSHLPSYDCGAWVIIKAIAHPKKTSVVKSKAVAVPTKARVAKSKT